MNASGSIRKYIGNCIKYNGETKIGIEFEYDQTRPLIVAHPAAARHYEASMSLFEDFEHPFVQIVIDKFPAYPDCWPDIITETVSSQTYQRLNDTVSGYPVFRRTVNSNPHWQIQVNCDATQYLDECPLIDIMYVDWFDWIDKGKGSDYQKMLNLFTVLTKKIRDGGLLIIDNKHHFPFDKLLQKHTIDKSKINLGGATIQYTGFIEWLGTNAYSNCNVFSAMVFEVANSANQYDEDAVQFTQSWLADSIPEFSLSKQQISKLIEKKAEQSCHVDAYTWDVWQSNWQANVLNDNIFVGQSDIIPLLETWSLTKYSQFLHWLMDNHNLPENIEPISYQSLDGKFTIHLVHGDIVSLAPKLYDKKTAIAVRHSLTKKILNRCPWWKGQMVEIQSAPSWLSNSVKNITWSGKADRNLIFQLFEQFFIQQATSLEPRLRLKNLTRLITVANSTGQLSELFTMCEDCVEKLAAAKLLNDEPLELIIIHKDSDDYREDFVASNWQRIQH